MRNVARTWAFETGLLVGKTIGPELPYNDYYEVSLLLCLHKHFAHGFLQYYAPDYELDVRASNMDNANSPEYLEKIKNQVIENLKRTAFAPSVQMTDVPRDPEGMDDEADAILDDEDEDQNKDQRMTKRRWDKYVEKEGELSESEDEEENQRNGVHRQPGVRKRRNMMDYQNPDAISDEDAQEGASARAPSHDSGEANGSHPAAVNGSGLYDSNTPSPAASQPSLDAEDTTMQDADVDGDDETNQTATDLAHPVIEAQEATPPDSPPTLPVNPAHDTQSPAASETHNDDESVMDLPTAHENGIIEREEENATAEKRTELAADAEEEEL